MAPQEFDIRYTEMEDLSYLQKWFKEEGVYKDFPFNAKEGDEMLKNWIGFSRFKASLTGLIQDVPCAIGTLFLMPYKKIAHHCSFYLIVDPEKRGLGIGTSMVKNLVHLAKTRFRLESVHVEVYNESSLIPILKKLDFELIFTQDDFVLDEGIFKPRHVWEYRIVK